MAERSLSLMKTRVKERGEGGERDHTIHFINALILYVYNYVLNVYIYIYFNVYLSLVYILHMIITFVYTVFTYFHRSKRELPLVDH